MRKQQEAPPIEVETIGDSTPYGVTWNGEYYPVTVMDERWTKDCEAKIYTIKSEDLLARIRHNVLTGAWTLEPNA